MSFSNSNNAGICVQIINSEKDYKKNKLLDITKPHTIFDCDLYDGSLELKLSSIEKKSSSFSSAFSWVGGWTCNWGMEKMKRISG